MTVVSHAGPSALDAGGEGWATGGATSPPVPDGAAPAPGGWDVGGALGLVRDGYLASHGRSPLDGSAAAALGEEDDALAHRRRDAPHVRWLVSWRVAAAAAVVVVLGAGTVAVRASTRASGPAVEIPAPAVTTTSHAAAGSGDARDRARTTDPAASPSAGSVVVHVVGAVTAPGVVGLPDGARVADALAAAGGAAADADLSTVNLARVVVDGEQVVVLRVGEQPAAPLPTSAGGGGASAAGSAPAGLVDLNTADVTALDALPGIGPVLAQRIVEHRAEHPFTTVDELADVRGIGPALLETLRSSVRV
ncbi:ComEA family DNA-binding protein [Cellulomonas algicola]|uniref:ComEA family DNA-binding protein n=1 Tax=Cellulomonas algicola TaxID=2071633 RepID=UPI0026874DBF|nr:helix-hairpin-helix domain-containing protein [Cellulomonas algicola]